MKKYILLLLFLGIVFLTGATAVSADCVEWVAGDCKTPNCGTRRGVRTCDEITWGCAEYYWTCNGTTTSCGSLEYACSTGCCPIGEVCDPAGSCPTGCGHPASTVPDGSCGETTCDATGSCCDTSYPTAPYGLTPTSNTQLRVGTATTLQWSGPSSWGENCGSGSPHYVACVMSAGSSCDLLSASTTATSYSWTPTVGDSSVTWKVAADNGALSTYSADASVCVEGFSSTSTTYVSAWNTWSSCSADHLRTRTRTCSENCGADDCTAFMDEGNAANNCPSGSTCTYNSTTKTQTETQDCIGTISGYLFDASDYDSTVCTDLKANPGNYNDFMIKNQGFSMTSPYTTSPFWPPSVTNQTTTVTTDANGHYTINAYAPGVYSYDFSALAGQFTEVDSPKVLCSGFDTATLNSSSTSCLVRPCPPLSDNNIFGFIRIYSGWWQVSGGSVYAAGGVKSVIPSTLSSTDNMKLILPVSGRSGVLSYGTTWDDTNLGTNPNAKVSTPLWRIESLYQGLKYDYNYYKTRMEAFSSKVWASDSIDNYDDGETGYQVYESDSTVSIDSEINLSGDKKVVLLVNGDVNVNRNISVANGSFLAIIANGTITFNTNVTNAEGWFVSETISIPCSQDISAGTCDKDDVQFVGEGSFVAWTAMNLQRIQAGILNNSQPSEKFTYRSDFFINAPSPVKVYVRSFAPFVP